MLKLKILALALLTVLAPTKAVISTTFVLVIADFIVGVGVSLKVGRPLTSRGFKTTVMKLLSYEFVLLLSYLVGQYLTGPSVPVLSIVAGIIGLTELKSIIENLDSVLGRSTAAAIIESLKNITSSPNKE